MVQDDPPRGLVACAAAMAFVHDDEVEEVGRVVAKDAERIAAVGHRLVEGEVDLTTSSGLASDLPNRVAEHRLELTGDRLVDQDVAVGKVEDSGFAAWNPTAVPQLPHGL